MKKLGLNSNVLFLGHRTDIAEILSNINVFVLCSHSEGLPLALLEAGSVGVPVVLTDTSNKAGLIKHKESGLVVEKTASALAKGIRQSLEQPEKAKEMARILKKSVQEDYSLDKSNSTCKDRAVSHPDPRGLLRNA